MKKVTVLLILIIITFIHADQPNQLVQFDDNWGKQGFTLTSSSKSNVQINYSIETLQFEEIEIAGEKFTSVIHPRQMLPAEESTPNLAGESYFIAIPQGADVNVSMLDHRMTVYNDLNIPPAPRIPWDTDNKPLQYSKDNSIYNRNAFYPEKIITVSDPTKIRGVDVVIIGIKPFQYNPVTKQLRVYTDISLQVQFIGGNGIFGEERLRSIWYEPILKSAILNYDILPGFDLKKTSTSRIAGYEYIIFCPDDPAFLAWADSIAVFRNEQGIITGVVTTDEIGGNNTNAIENYLNDAYNTWHSPPVAFLLLGDYGTSGNTIVSPIFEEYCVSDHIYADVTENQIEDIIPARITARDEAELATMISKMLDLERNPPTDSNFYNNPITALGWETERWFQVCAETVGGFWHNELGKDQIRINEIFEGDPSVDPWSTAPNSTTVLNYFGSSGLGYIPQTPAEMGGWSGGNAAMINNAINSGAFMLLHRDHGGIIGWAEPTYLLGDLDNLINENPVFVYSMNCKTGMYNNPEECFAEKFHRHQYGALGLVAASEMSMSFVNDTYL